MILPELGDMLMAEQRRHFGEVAAIRRFHAFMSAFEASGGEIDGKPYKLRGISIEDKVASFQGPYGDYFYDAGVPEGACDV